MFNMNVKAGRSICNKAKPSRRLPQKYTLFAFCQYIVSTFLQADWDKPVKTQDYRYIRPVIPKELFKMLLF